MELLLLLLVIFLQLGGGLGVGWGQGWEWVTMGRGLQTLVQPQPALNWAPGGRRESHWGGETDTPQREVCSP